MKRIIIIMVGAVAVAELVYCMARSKPAPVSGEQAATETVAPAEVEFTRPAHATRLAAPVLDTLSSQTGNHWAPRPVASPATTSAMDVETASRVAFRQSMETLESSQSTFAQRQAAWKQLKDSGQIDQAIGELQERLAADPQAPQYPAALGEAYLKKCSLTDDIREKAILAMNADRLFDTALNLDPTDWEARYTKAVGMSYWPASLNKGQDVINNFLTLIQQQEAQPSQPEYALSYLHLGDQYKSLGNSDYAQQAWARGAQLFPGNTDLQSRLAPAK